jgi:hypothetical protein
VSANLSFKVEIPEIDDAAIERLAELFVSLLDTLEQDERTPGGEVPPVSKAQACSH